MLLRRRSVSWLSSAPPPSQVGGPKSIYRTVVDPADTVCVCLCAAGVLELRSVRAGDTVIRARLSSLYLCVDRAGHLTGQVSPTLKCSLTTALCIHCLTPTCSLRACLYIHCLTPTCFLVPCLYNCRTPTCSLTTCLCVH